MSVVLHGKPSFSPPLRCRSMLSHSVLSSFLSPGKPRDRPERPTRETGQRDRTERPARETNQRERPERLTRPADTETPDADAQHKTHIHYDAKNVSSTRLSGEHKEGSMDWFIRFPDVPRVPSLAHPKSTGFGPLRRRSSTRVPPPWRGGHGPPVCGREGGTERRRGTGSTPSAGGASASCCGGPGPRSSDSGRARG